VIRVLIAAGSPVLRAGLEAVVRSSSALEFAGALSPGELENGAREFTADILLLELPNLERDWITTQAEISIPSVVLTEIADPAAIAAGLRSGVRSILSTDASGAEIIAAIVSAMAGLITVQPATLELLVADPRPAPAELEEPLSPREVEVLAILAEGLSNKIIAHRMGISEHTVKFHVTSIMGKLQAGSRTEAVMQGIRRGLVMV